MTETLKVLNNIFGEASPFPKIILDYYCNLTNINKYHQITKDNDYYSCYLTPTITDLLENEIYEIESYPYFNKKLIIPFCLKTKNVRMLEYIFLETNMDSDDIYVILNRNWDIIIRNDFPVSVFAHNINSNILTIVKLLDDCQYGIGYVEISYINPILTTENKLLIKNKLLEFVGDKIKSINLLSL